MKKIITNYKERERWEKERRERREERGERREERGERREERGVRERASIHVISSVCDSKV